MTEERDFLHRSDEITIELIVDEAESVARFLFSTDGSASWDLTAQDDVVVVFEGMGVPFKAASPHEATATIDLADLDSGGTLMVRVHEFLDGWEF